MASDSLQPQEPTTPSNWEHTPHSKRKPKRLSGRERKFIRALASGKTMGQAAIEAGYSSKHPSQAASQALRHIQDRIPDIMDRSGLSDVVLINKYLRPALEAKETEFAKFEGKITDQVDVVAWGPRLNALDMAFKLKGSYPKDGGTVSFSGDNMQIVNYIARPDRNPDEAR